MRSQRRPWGTAYAPPAGDDGAGRTAGIGPRAVLPGIQLRRDLGYEEMD